MTAKGFGERLAQERRLKAVAEWRDITAAEIARDLDTSGANLSRWENSRHAPKDDGWVAKLAAYFGVTSTWLRYGEGERESGTASAPIAIRPVAPPPAIKNPKPPLEKHDLTGPGPSRPAARRQKLRPRQNRKGT